MSGGSWGSGRPVKWRSSGGSGSTRDLSSGTRFWAENGDFGVKIDEISWMKDGETWEMLDPLETKQIHGSKSTKHHQTNKSQKKLGLFFGGDFRILGQNQQN